MLAGDQVQVRNRGVLLGTLAAGVACGIIQLLALGPEASLLPLGLLLGTGYFLLALSRRIMALAIFLVAFVEFWGFLPDSFSVGDAKLIDIILGILIVPVALDLARGRIRLEGDSGRNLRLAGLIFAVLIAGQVLLTTQATGQSVWLSIKAAKPYLYYFAFLLVPVFAGTPEKVRKLAGWMTATASILALLYLLVSLIGKSGPLPGLILGEANFIGLGTFTRVRSNGAPLIVAMMLYQFYRFAEGRSSRLEKLSLLALAMGALVHFYRSLWVGVLVAVVVQASIEGKRGARNVAKFLLVLLVLSLGIGVLRPGYGEMILSRAISTMTEVEQISGSYGVRHEQIARWTPILRDNWLVGIGFLHHDSDVGQQLESLYALEGTGNYDIGWVDLLGRLGSLGTVLLVVGIFYLSKGAWKAGAYTAGGDVALLRRTLVAWIVVGITSLPGYPLLSCAGGVLPMAIFAGMLMVLGKNLTSSPRAVADETSHDGITPLPEILPTSRVNH